MITVLGMARRSFDDSALTSSTECSGFPPDSTDSSSSSPPYTAMSGASSSETWREDAWSAHGVPSAFVQDNHSRSRRGTVRGIHFQTHPGQGKLVRCARGVGARRGRRPPARLGDVRRVGVRRARRRPRAPALDPDRVRARLLRALGDRRLRLQVHRTTTTGRPRRGSASTIPTSGSSGRTDVELLCTRSATATRRGWPRWPTRCRSRCERRPLRPQPDGHAAPREPAHGAARVAVRPLGRVALPGADGGPRRGPRPGGRRRRSSSPTWPRSGSTGTGRSSTSRRGWASYSDALEALRGERRLYECFCTRAEIREAASAAHGPLPEGAYPGTCLRLSAAELAEKRASGRPPALRVRADGARVAFDGPAARADRGRGRRLRRAPRRRRVRLQPRGRRRRRGAGRSSEVVRGSDLADSTPRQLWLARALGLPEPAYAHVPLVLGPDGARLAKRHGDVTLREVPPADALAWMATSLGFAGRTAQELAGCVRSARGCPAPTPASRGRERGSDLAIAHRPPAGCQICNRASVLSNSQI